MDRVSNSTVAKRPFCFWSACHAEKEAGQEEAEHDTKKSTSLGRLYLGHTKQLMACI